jgi:hypothetical protein
VEAKTWISKVMAVGRNAGCWRLPFVLLLSLAAALSVQAQSPTATMLSLSATDVPASSPVTLTGLVITGGSPPGGSVTFYECNSPLGSASVSAVSATNYIPYSDNLSQGWRVDENSGTIHQTSTINGPVPWSPPSEMAGAGAWVKQEITAPSDAANLTFSMWLRTTNGGPHEIQIEVEDAVTGQTDAKLIPTITGQWARYSLTASSPPNPQVKLYISSYGESGGPFDVLVWGLQLEAAATPGPYITTNSESAPFPSNGVSGYGGLATYTATFSASGAQALTATYSDGTGVFAGSTSSAVWLWVEPANSITLSSSPNPSGYLSPVTLTAVWTGAGQGQTVSFYNGNGSIGTAQTNASGKATLTTSTLPGGATAVVAANSNLTAVSIPYIQTVIFPTIQAVSPCFGNPGDTITITGNEFGATQNGSIVQFNGAAAAVTSWTNTQIIVTVPAGATSGPLTVTVNGYTPAPAMFRVGAFSCVFAGLRDPAQQDRPQATSCKHQHRPAEKGAVVSGLQPVAAPFDSFGSSAYPAPCASLASAFPVFWSQKRETPRWPGARCLLLGAVPLAPPALKTIPGANLC